MDKPTEFSVKMPYPPIRVEGPNTEYGKAMLSNMGGAVSEMSAVSLYFYDHLVTEDYQDVARTFHEVSIVEMHHLEIFGELALLLGQNPRLWEEQYGEKEYWTPAYNQYSFDLKTLLLFAIHSEKAAIRKYKTQAQMIKDPYIVANLERIILDEDLHVQIFTDLYHAYFR